MFNEHFLSKFGGIAVPFREVMMDGDTAADIYSEEFINLRSSELNISKAEYRANITVCDVLNKGYSEVRLWFGKDTFCQMNLLTLLAYLEQSDYSGKVVLNCIDDETFEVIEANIIVHLGIYKKAYADILICRQLPEDFGVLTPDAVKLYFDYHSSDGALARMARDNSDMDKTALVCLLLENSNEYGLSDIQAEKLIRKYRE